MAESIRVGQCVKWFAGGPVMVIRGIDAEPAPNGRHLVTCIWFTRDWQLAQAVFPADELRVVETPAES